jgi:hypothetical protein
MPPMPAWEFIETAAAALLWAGIFLLAGSADRAFALLPDRRSIMSFSAGMAVAFVFMHMMPELHEVRTALADTAPVALPYEGVETYFLALIGFLTFYGFDRLNARMHEAGAGSVAGPAFHFHIGAFAAYVALMGYLLVNSLRETEVSVALYAAAIAFHFLAVDNALRNEHGALYERIGRRLLAAMAVLGWGAGILFALPLHVVALLVAFLSGAIIMNSTIMELRSEQSGRFLPMLAGGLLYGLILLPFG